MHHAVLASHEEGRSVDFCFHLVAEKKRKEEEHNAGFLVVKEYADDTAIFFIELFCRCSVIEPKYVLLS